MHSEIGSASQHQNSAVSSPPKAFSISGVSGGYTDCVVEEVDDDDEEEEEEEEEEEWDYIEDEAQSINSADRPRVRARDLSIPPPASRPAPPLVRRHNMPHPLSFPRTIDRINHGPKPRAAKMPRQRESRSRCSPAHQIRDGIKQTPFVSEDSNEDAKLHSRAGQSSDINLSSDKTVKADLQSHLDNDELSKLDLEELKQYIGMLQDKAQQFEEIQQARFPQRYQILYRIGDVHSSPIYLDHPEWVPGSPHIRSGTRLQNFDLYLERNKDISFIVYRDFDSYDQTQAEDSSSPHHQSESICAVADDLDKALKFILKFEPEYSSLLHHYRSTQEIRAPYLFIYHSRQHWENILNRFSPSTKEQLNRLTNYVFGQYGHEYSTADSLFSQRKISADFVKYLFKPGEILVACEDNEHLGYVAESWPEFTSYLPRNMKTNALERRDRGSDDYQDSLKYPGFDDYRSSVDLSSSSEVLVEPLPGPNIGNTGPDHCAIKAWRWGFDGQFKRQQEELILQLPQPKPGCSNKGPFKSGEGHRANGKRKEPFDRNTMKMEELNVYPMRYASELIVKKLRRRGQMFWKCRERCLISYREHENGPAENPVSSPLIVNKVDCEVSSTQVDAD